MSNDSPDWGAARSESRTAMETIPSPSSEPPPSSLKLSDGGSMWTSSNGLYWPSRETYKTLPPGLYRGGANEAIGTYLIQMTVSTDHLLELPDTKSYEILDEAAEFVKLRPDFQANGFLHKRGILLYGPPGSGKTSTIQQLIKMVIDRSGMVFFVEHPGLAIDCLRMIRRIEPERLILAVLEDLDAMTERWGEAPYLALLDGESQVDNIIFLATTNYPERLDRRFVDRPSRFDTVELIDMPSEAARRVYLGHKMKEADPELIRDLASKTDGYSIAHLKELVVLLLCFRKTPEQALERLARFRKKKSSEDYGKAGKSVGFLSGAVAANTDDTVDGDFLEDEEDVVSDQPQPKRKFGF